MKKQLLFLCTFISLSSFLGINVLLGQGNSCSNATPFCVKPGHSFNFVNVSDGSHAPYPVAGYPSYGCLASGNLGANDHEPPDPSWFYLETTGAGTLTYTLAQGTTLGGTNIDVDFVCWGPFTAATFSTACASGLVGSCTGGPGNLTPNPGCTGGIVDCSYSTAGVEVCTIPATAANQFYIILITNYSGAGPTYPGTSGYVDISADPSNLPTNCAIACPTSMTMLMDDSTTFWSNSWASNSGNVNNGATLTCSKSYVIWPSMPTTLVDPYTDLLTPCVAVDFTPLTSGLQTKGSYTISGGGSTAVVSTGNIGTGYSAGSDFTQYWFMVDSTASESFNFCKSGSVTSGTYGTPTVSIQNCWDNTIYPTGGPVTWSGGGATCFSLSIPGGTGMGDAYYTISPASGATGIFDSNAGYLTVDPSQLPSSTTYTVTYHFKGSASCNMITGTFVFTTPAGPTLNVTPSNTAICNGSSTILTASGTANTYVWSTSATTASISVTPTTTTVYTVTGTKTSTGCESVATATITVNPPPSLTLASPSYTICKGNGVSISASGATTYTWSPGTGLSGTNSGTVTANPTSTQVYNVQGSSGGCTTAVSTVTVTVNNPTGITITPSSTAVCSGNSATLTTSGTSTYTWSANAGGGSTSPVTVSPSSPTSYSISGLDANGCLNTNSVTISVSTTPTVTVAGGGPSSQAVCSGASVAAINFAVNPAGTVSWTNNNTATGIAATGTTNINTYTAPNVVTSQTGVITVSAVTTAGGCPSTPATGLTYTVTINPTPTVSIVSGGSSQSVCSGASVNGISFSVSPAGNIGWTNNNTTIGVAATGTTDIAGYTAPNVATSQTGVITVTATTTTGSCPSSAATDATYTITINPTPTVTIAGGGSGQTVCAGAPVAPINFNISPAGTINWTNNNTAIGIAASGTTNIATYTSPSVTATTTGVITANAVSTVGGCPSSAGTSAVYTVTINPAPAVDTLGMSAVSTMPGCGLSTGCINGITGIGGAGAPYTFAWGSGAYTSSSTNCNIPAGVYEVHVKDAGGCKDSMSITLNSAGAPTTPTLTSASTFTYCQGVATSSTLTAVAPTGDTIVWYNGGTYLGHGTSFITPSNLPVGTTIYAAIDSSSSGCKSLATTTASITVYPIPGPPTIGGSSNPLVECQGGTQSVSVTPTGTIAVTPTWYDNSGNFVFAGTNFTPPSTNTGTVVYSVADSISMAGGCVSHAAGNVLSVTVTINGAPLPPHVTSTPNPASYCQGQTYSPITATPSAAGDSIVWYIGGTYVGVGTSFTPPLGLPLDSTVYEAIDSTVAGCKSAATAATVTVIINPTPATPTVTSSPIDTTYCQGVAYNPLNAVGTGGTLTWYLNGAYSGTVTPYAIPTTLVPGSYTFTVMDSINATCKSAFSGTAVTITIDSLPKGPILSGGTNNNYSYCQGTANPTLSVSPVGTPPPTVVWYLGANEVDTGLTFTPSTSGVYVIYDSSKVTGCISKTNGAVQTITVTINPLPSPPVLSGGLTPPVYSICQTLPIPTLTVTVSGTPSPIPVWYVNGVYADTGTTYTPANNLGTTIYTVYDSSRVGGCVNLSAGAVQQVTVTINPMPTGPVIGLNPDTLSECQGVSPGGSLAVTPTSSGGYTTTPVWYIGSTYVTSGNSFTPSTANPALGVVYTVADSVITPGLGGCVNNSAGNTVSFTVNVYPAATTPTITSIPVDTLYCQNATTKNITAFVGGGNIVWYINGVNTHIVGQSSIPVSSAVPGVYVYMAKDSMTLGGCTNSGPGSIATVTVSQLPSIVTSGLHVDTAYCGYKVGGIQGLQGVGTGTLSYQWYLNGNPIAGATTPNIVNMGPGTYSLVVTDANGCSSASSGSSANSFTVPSVGTVTANISANPTTGYVPLPVTFSNNTVGATPATTWNWVFGDTVGTSTAFAPTYTYTSAGTYTAWLYVKTPTTYTTCVDTSNYVTITVEVSTTIIIPNIFSPNGDGINDQFFIINTGLSSLSCNIFNRWGQLLYTINSANESWDGRTPNGEKAPDGTYMYILQAQGLNGKSYKQNGTVTLVR